MSTLVADPNSLTKEKLKSELKAYDIPLPPSDSLKSVYVELYRTEILDKQRNGLDMFSSGSDDEGSTTSSKRKKKDLPKKKDPVIEKTNVLRVSDLSDEQISTLLKEHGVNVGPIVDSTRRVYQKKLEKLLHDDTKAEPLSDVTDGQVNGRVELDENEFSDLDASMDESPPPTPEKKPVRKQRSPRKQMKTASVEEKLSSQVKQPSAKQDQVKHKIVVSNYSSSTTEVVTQAQPESLKTKRAATKVEKRRIPIWLQAAFVVGLAVLIYFVIQSMEPMSHGKVGQLPGSK